MPKTIGYSRSEENFPGSDITADEWEFIQAVEAYKRAVRRKFPSWREVFGVLKALGYRKVAPPEPLCPKRYARAVSPPSPLGGEG